MPTRSSVRVTTPNSQEICAKSSPAVSSYYFILTCFTPPSESTFFTTLLQDSNWYSGYLISKWQETGYLCSLSVTVKVVTPSAVGSNDGQLRAQFPPETTVFLRHLDANFVFNLINLSNLSNRNIRLVLFTKTSNMAQSLIPTVRIRYFYSECSN